MEAQEKWSFRKRSRSQVLPGKKREDFMRQKRKYSRHGCQSSCALNWGGGTPERESRLRGDGKKSDSGETWPALLEGRGGKVTQKGGRTSRRGRKRGYGGGRGGKKKGREKSYV